MKYRSFFLSLLLFSLVFYLGGCSSSSNDDDDSDDSTSTVELSGTVSLNQSQTLSGGGLSNYILWFQNQGTGYTYETDVESNGDYSLDLGYTDDETSGDQFIGALIQKEPLEFAGVVLMQDKSGSTTANTGLGIRSEIEDMNIEVDAANGRAIVLNPDQVASLNRSSGFKVYLKASEGAPIGFGNVGKGSDSKTGESNNSNKRDFDQDGIPDIFDAMNDGLTLDNARESGDLPKLDGIFGRRWLDHAIMFMNLKVDKAAVTSANIVTNNALITVELQSNGLAPISSVRADLLHSSWKTGATLDHMPGRYTDEADPHSHTEGSSWTSPNSLHKATRDSDGKTVWTVLFKPNLGSFEPGHLMRLKVTRKTGRVTYHWMSINFKFTSTVTDTTDWGSISTAGTGSQSAPFTIPTTGNVDLTWSHPKDEGGVDLSGLKYQVELRYYDSSNQEIATEIKTVSGVDPTAYTLDASDIDLHNSNTPPTAYIQADITARYPYGDNAAVKIYFKRSDW